MRSGLILLCTLPLVPAAASIAAPIRITRALTVAAGALALVLAVLLIGPASRGPVAVGFLRADALSAVFVLATAFLYLMTAIYSVGYVGDQTRQTDTPDDGPDSDHDTEGEEADAEEAGRHARRFYVGLNVFAWSMLCAPLMDGLAMLWVAIEITTVVSALLVAVEDTDAASEAAWKYLLIASAGLGIGLLATVFMYSAGAPVLGNGYDLSFNPLITHAHQLAATPVRLAFVLAVLGFGTKVGWVPVHTWLPDAHAEAPTPVSALLSGSLLAVSFYAVLRYFQVARLTLGTGFPQTVLLVFGVASLLLGAVYLLDQRDIKRMLAYSSVEHMGILAIGVSFGTPIAAIGVLLHVLAHAAAKGGAFLGAGILVRAYRSKDIARIRDGLARLPVSGTVFLLLIAGLSAFPPGGIFRSEFLIVAGGLASPAHLAAAVLVVLVTLAFAGLAVSTTRMVVTPGPVAPAARPVRASTSPPRPSATHTPTIARTVVTENATGEPDGWMVVPVVICLGVLVMLGLHVPGALSDLITTAAGQLTGRSG
jgi:hydrogenase-4 component F